MDICPVNIGGFDKYAVHKSMKFTNDCWAFPTSDEENFLKTAMKDIWRMECESSVRKLKEKIV